MGDLDMAWFPAAGKNIGTSKLLVRHEKHTSSTDGGVLIYFTAFSGDVATELGRVEKAGGKVMVPKKLISDDVGYIGVFADAEGNCIALHVRRM